MTEEKVQEKLIECYQEAKTYLYPGHLTFRQRLFEQADELLMNCFEKNMKASKVKCQTLIERLYQPVEMELFQTTCKDLEQQLIQFKRSIQLILKEYKAEANAQVERLDGLTNAEREPGRFVFDFLERMQLNGSTYHHAVGFLQQCITALGEVDISKVPSRRVG